MKTATLVLLVAVPAVGVGLFAGVQIGEARVRQAVHGSPATLRTGATTSYLQAALFEAGDHSIIARPIFPLHSGVVVPVKNIAPQGLAFGRFELVGTVPPISKVLVPGKAFTVTSDGDRAFTLTGDTIDPNETIEVFIAFSGETSEQGAVLARFNES